MAIRYVNEETLVKAFIVWHHICRLFSGPSFSGARGTVNKANKRIL